MEDSLKNSLQSKAVLFDYDGTIVDTNKVIIESWQHTFQMIEGKKRELYEILDTFGEPLPKTIEKFFGTELLDKAIDIYRSWQIKHFSGLIELFDGVIQTLQKLKNMGVKIAIVTSRGRRTTLEGLRKLGILKYFDVIVTSDDCQNFKPNPEPINIALENLGVDRKNAIMVGDTKHDLGASKNADVRFALVSWSISFKKEDVDEDNMPDYYLNNVEEIVGVLNNDY